MEYKGEKESEDYPGFYHVPMVEHILISVDGKIINTEKGYCPFHQLWGGYPAVSIGRGESAHVHRLLALTFVPSPFDEIFQDDLEVNHKDGVKTNNSLDNLEWVTWSGNLLHAYQNGLRRENLPVLVKDLRDESITRYYSLGECARAFGTSASQIHVYLRKYNRGKVTRNHYVFIYEGDD